MSLIHDPDLHTESVTLRASHVGATRSQPPKEIPLNTKLRIAGGLVAAVILAGGATACGSSTTKAVTTTTTKAGVTTTTKAGDTTTTKAGDTTTTKK